MAQTPVKGGVKEATATGILGMLGEAEKRHKILSDLDEEEIGTLTLLDTIGKKMKIDVLNKFVESFCHFRISRHRMGRRELAGILTMAGYGTEDRRRSRSIKDLFGGIRILIPFALIMGIYFMPHLVMI